MPTIITVLALFVFLFLIIGALVFIHDKRQKKAALRKMKARQDPDNF